jgi:sialate O-acetylesterase
MILPIINYTIKGAIWYQGESNKGNYNDYAALQASMVANWRKSFGVGEFPFYFVQIAPYSYGNNKAFDSALQRDEQLKSMSLIPNSGMVTTLDIGEEKSIHPSEKAIVAKRLAYWAFSQAYGFKGISYQSPTYKDLIVKDDIAVVSFDNAETGLSSFGKEVECFEVAGEDSIFYPAKMTINKKQVRVWSSQVKNPVAVRYGFCNFPKTAGYLYSTAGLPVPSFRTDNWSK